MESDAILGNVRVGAHYYSWFPNNFSQGYLRSKLSPPQEPVFGEYSSRSREVVEAQIEMASGAGIDFFTLDYWPTREGYRENLRVFLTARNLSKMSFAVFYELWDLGFDSGDFATTLDRADLAVIEDDFRFFATNYFTNPSYLKVDGRPVVFLYLTRTLIRDVASPFARMRAVARELGFELFLIADEVYWINSQTNDDGEIEIVGSPDVLRGQQFDAMFMYNPYAPGLVSQSGYASTSTLFADIDSLYSRYRAALPEVPIVPMAMPGYNDRGVRLSVENYAIPRQWAVGESETSFLEQMLKRSTIPNIDVRLPMVLLTSWNEWNEDTAIEPNRLSSSGPSSDAASSELLTQGYDYGVYSEQYLELLSQLLEVNR